MVQNKHNSEAQNGDAINHSNEVIDARTDAKKIQIPQKVFSHRNSVLTDLMDLNHVQTVYNISVAVTSLLFFVTIAYYITVPHMLQEDFDILMWGFGKMHLFFVTWFGLNVLCHSVRLGLQFWAQHRHRLPSKVSDSLFVLFFICHVITMFVATPYVVLKYQLPPITSFSLLAEQVRMFMKIYSLIRENFSRIQKYNYNKDGSDVSSLCPSFNHFNLFMFAPVLIYRDVYPRTERIRWSFVASSFARFIACIFITYCIFMRFNKDIFQQVGLEPFHLRHMVFIATGCMFAGSLMMFMVFYAILHSWLNVFAELTRFGDRKFYEDWWNSTSFLQYYRMWNSVVYDWLYNYVYLDVHKMGLSRPLARLNVFVVSAAVHDYIICFALGYFFPALGIVYVTVGIILIFVTNRKTSSFWNTFMWLFLFSGWGVLIFMHSAEWYARRNCPIPEIGTVGWYIRSFSCLRIDNL